MSFEKKITMLSTKEWMQYLQYRLPIEREKELLEKAEYDPFLKEALDSINSSDDGRQIALNSLNQIHQYVYENTGVSESRISNITQGFSMPVFSKKILYFLILFFVLIGIGVGLFFFFKYYRLNFNSLFKKEEVAIETPQNNTIIQEENAILPIDTLASTAIDTTKKVSATALQIPSSTLSVTNSTSTITTPNTTKEKTKKESNKNQNTSSQESDKIQFEKAQELYKEGNVEDSKAILNKLKSYENPYKSNAENILNNLNQ